MTGPEAYEAVLKFFGGDKKKAELWWNTENPHLGGTTPLRLVAMGRGHKLYQWIECSLEENTPTEPGIKGE